MEFSNCKYVVTTAIGMFVTILWYLIADVRLVKVFPSVGNVLGGTPVVVSGPCVQDIQDASDISVTCTFDRVSVEGEYLMNQSQFLCITPQLQTIGRIPFTLEFTEANTSHHYSGHATFYIGKHYTTCINPSILNGINRVLIPSILNVPS